MTGLNKLECYTSLGWKPLPIIKALLIGPIRKLQRKWNAVNLTSRTIFTTLYFLRRTDDWTQESVTLHEAEKVCQLQIFLLIELLVSYKGNEFLWIGPLILASYCCVLIQKIKTALSTTPRACAIMSFTVVIDWIEWHYGNT